jgi:hypothetical protein
MSGLIAELLSTLTQPKLEILVEDYRLRDM